MSTAGALPSRDKSTILLAHAAYQLGDALSARHTGLQFREEELGGKTIVILGLGRIGSRLTTLARAFDMTVIGVKRDASTGGSARKPSLS